MTYEVGDKKPPKQYQFGQPNGNKPGLTSAARKQQIANAEKATKIREKLLDALAEKLDGLEADEAVALIDNAMNTLIKDTENRGFGMPTQQVDNISSDESMSQKPTNIILKGVAPEGEKND